MTALVTKEEVKAYLVLTGNTSDALIDDLILAASAFVLRYCDRTAFTIQSFSERYNGTGTQTLVPDQFPITAVSSVRIDGVSIPASSDWPRAAGYTFNKYGVMVRGYKFTKDVLNVDISYSAGYTETPEDVKQAVIEMVSMKFKRKDRIGVSSKTIGQETISYSSSDVSADIKAVLNQHAVRYVCR